MRKIGKWKNGLWVCLLLVCFGCEFTPNESFDHHLPLGLFKTHSQVYVSKVDSQGFHTSRIDTASFFVRLDGNGEWEQFEMIWDTCVYRRTLSRYALVGDTVLLTKNHGINYKIESKMCQETNGEYDRDTTLKVAIKGYSNDHIEIVGQELNIEKVFLYLKVNDSSQVKK